MRATIIEEIIKEIWGENYLLVKDLKSSLNGMSDRLLIKLLKHALNNK
tara:strand:- start:15 stop:158 length:144 start_codon:yes stop_codon:yes gene_type:complete